MAFEFSRNVQDLAVNPAAFALPSSASSSTNSAAIDLGTAAGGNERPDNLELELSVPALNSTIVPDTRTVTYVIETCAATNFSSIDQTLLSEVQTGAGGAGVGAFLKRVRLPSNCARYVRFKITFGASTTTGAAVSATGTVRF
jgi:hypothetical protein